MGILGAAEAATKSSGSSNYTFLLLIVLVFVGFYFLMIRPQRRRQQQVAQQQNTVAPGAQVRTTAGMYATVVEVDGDDVVLEVAPGVEVRYMKRAVMEVISPGQEVTEEEPVDSEYTEDDSEYVQDGAVSAEDDLADSHDDDLSVSDSSSDSAQPHGGASSNGTKAKSDSDVI